MAVDHFPYEIVIFCGSLGPVVVSSAHPVGVFTFLTMADLVPTILLAHLPIVLAASHEFPGLQMLHPKVPFDVSPSL